MLRSPTQSATCMSLTDVSSSYQDVMLGRHDLNISNAVDRSDLRVHFHHMPSDAALYTCALDEDLTEQKIFEIMDEQLQDRILIPRQCGGKITSVHLQFNSLTVEIVRGDEAGYKNLSFCTDVKVYPHLEDFDWSLRAQNNYFTFQQDMAHGSSYTKPYATCFNTGTLFRHATLAEIADPKMSCLHLRVNGKVFCITRGNESGYEAFCLAEVPHQAPFVVVAVTSGAH